VAWEFNLTYNAFGVGVSDQHAPSRGTLTLSDAWNTALEPAPVSPSGKDATAYQLLSGTIKATYNAHRSIEGDNIYVSPGIMSGNTGSFMFLDWCRYLWLVLSEMQIRDIIGNLPKTFFATPTAVSGIAQHFWMGYILSMRVRHAFVF